MSQCFFLIIIIKAFLTFTYKIEIKKKKRRGDAHTHAYIVQIEEYKAKHTQSYYAPINVKPQGGGGGLPTGN